MEGKIHNYVPLTKSVTSCRCCHQDRGESNQTVQWWYPYSYCYSNFI